ncbi:unnamed protein product [Oppiella nova]|uniref:Uncharacterized protein n=1 Tax=Oppiella nova TaxID=334625 RepID=A0A7R9L9Q3_9ACAR|nr:unnamed protein product [Oppiella nova]CAG2160273.1 unnamed protein product [Oppiella nova]
MNIAVITKEPFNGVIHTRDFRKSPCLQSGDGGLNTTLTINLLAKPDENNFCGVHRLKGSEERTVALTVRVHKTLELSDDKYYIITCSQSGFRNARNELSRVSLKLLDKGSKVVRVVHGNQYTLRAEISSPDANCPQLQCNSDDLKVTNDNKDLALSKDSVQLLASTTVFVVEPGAQICFRERAVRNRRLRSVQNRLDPQFSLWVAYIA